MKKYVSNRVKRKSSIAMVTTEPILSLSESASLFTFKRADEWFVRINPLINSLFCVCISRCLGTTFCRIFYAKVRLYYNSLKYLGLRFNKRFNMRYLERTKDMARFDGRIDDGYRCQICFNSQIDSWSTSPDLLTDWKTNWLNILEDKLLLCFWWL